MSREAFGDPPESQEPPQVCPVCGGEWHAEDCEFGKEVARRLRLEREAAILSRVLQRMLEAPTTQVSPSWKDAIRQAMTAALPDSKTPNAKLSGLGRTEER